MRFAAWKQIAVPALMVFSWLPASSQALPPQAPTFKVDTQLALVDVVAEIKEKSLHTRAPLTELRKEDVRVVDNGREVSIRTFDIGAHYETRPIALWLVVQCNIGAPPEWNSGFLGGKSGPLRPVLGGLHLDDAVGVAHWCDDGAASLDLPPGHDPDAALAMVDRLLGEPPALGENRAGEQAMQKMI